MLGSAERDLARRDPELPGLATVIDPDCLFEMLRRIARCDDRLRGQISYIRYKPRSSCLVAYAVTSERDAFRIHVTAYPRHNWQARRETHLGLCSRQRTCLLPPAIDELAVTVSVFPCDRVLRSLLRLEDGDARRRLVARILPERQELQDAAIRTLAYKPERRYVGQLVADGNPLAVLKFYSRPGYEAAQRTSTQFASRILTRIARPLGRSDRDQMVGFEWLAGTPLDDLLAASNCPRGSVERVAAAIAELHTQPPAGLARWTGYDEAKSLLALSEDLGFLCPQLAQRASHLGDRLALGMLNQPAVSGPIHGDFYCRQVVLTARTVGILDLDEAVIGDPAADLGNLLAHLEREVVCQRRTRSSCDSITEALLSGYEQATEDREVLARVTLYTAKSLFRLACHPFRFAEPDWTRRSEAILDRVQHLLQTDAPPLRAHRGVAPIDGRRVFAKPAVHSAHVRVVDPFSLAKDPGLSSLTAALDPVVVQHELNRCLPDLPPGTGEYELIEIRVTRHKPGRRCLIEYDLLPGNAKFSDRRCTIVGKARVKGLDRHSYEVQQSLYRSGFDGQDDAIGVPRPIGVIPRFRMWLQHKVAGVVATELLSGPGRIPLARRIAEALHKLHRSEIATDRRHLAADELRLLRQRLAALCTTMPHWAERIGRVLDGCERLAVVEAAAWQCGIHRDFYADQVLVDGHRLYLVDLDLYCQGDPCLDVGNFVAHLKELALRKLGRQDSLVDVEHAFTDRYLELAGRPLRNSINAYTTLTLARHIQLSTQFPDRAHLSQHLLGLCEQRLKETGFH